MAINDISLTAGMRSNLVALQGTVTLLNRTQDRLSTGKKVNTALDNPLNFFTAKALNSRAADLTSFKDGMSEAVQTIKAANAGITAIEGLIAQAKAVAASAKTTAVGGSGTLVTEQITMTSVASGTTITIGGLAFTATSCSIPVTGPPGIVNFYVGGSDAMDAAALANAITAAGVLSSVVMSYITVSNVSGNVITLSAAGSDMQVGQIIAGTGAVTTMLPGGATERANYLTQYQTIMAQLDKVASDSSYKGINFLAATGNSLDVLFGTSATDKITITGQDTSSAALLIATTTSSWATNANIDTDITKMTTAENTLKTQTSTLSSSLSIITVRQDWVTSMVNTLVEGGDKLTLADMNEEGANMLMLQTRQTLGTTALSLSAQAAQSVLRLFA